MKRQLTAIILGLMAVASYAETSSQSFPALGATGGRFVLGQVSDYQRDKFLLDTQTGRTWIVVCVDDKPQCSRAFQPVAFIDTKGDYSAAPPSGK